MDFNKTLFMALGIVVELAVGLMMYDYHVIDTTRKAQEQVLKEVGVNFVK